MSWRRPLHFVHRLSRGAASRLRGVYYRALGVRMTGPVWLRRIEIARNWEDVLIEEGAALDFGVSIVTNGPPRAGKVTIGARTYVNRYTMLDGHQHVEIGRDCMIGPHCYITDGEHGTAPGRLVKQQPNKTAPVIIEDGVWLGSHVVVLAGVRIGRGAVIGAGSVVTRDIPANAVAVGVPARVIRTRDQDLTSA